MSEITKDFTGKTVEECVSMAAKEFGITSEEVKYTVVQEASNGFLGLGKKDAVIKVTFEKAEAVVETVEKVEKENIAEAAKTETISETVEVKTETVSEESVNTEETAEPVQYEIPQMVYEIKDYLIDVIHHMGVEEISIDVEPNEAGALLTLNCNAENKGNIIGKRGETLDALQYLASVIANRNTEDYYRISLDSNGYRDKRKKTLENLAAKIAKNVLKSGRSNALEPMNPYERRIIHSVISEIEGVSSHSVGEEPYRKVIITSDNPKPRNNYHKGGKNNHGRRNNNSSRYRRDENYVPKPKSMDSMKTSFEKEYSKPKPEDSIAGGLYGKIEL